MDEDQTNGIRAANLADVFNDIKLDEDLVYNNGLGNVTFSCNIKIYRQNIDNPCNIQSLINPTFTRENQKHLVEVIQASVSKKQIILGNIFTQRLNNVTTSLQNQIDVLT